MRLRIKIGDSNDTKRTRNGIEYILIENIISLLYLLLVRLKNFFFMII